MLVKWLGLFPPLLAIAYAISWLPIDPPIWGKLLIETAILVPLLNYVITPFVDDVFADWLYAGVDGDRESADVGS